jgi:hypothetical protein
VKKSTSKLCYDRRSVGQSVLVSNTHLGPKTTFLLLSDSCEFLLYGTPSLTRGRVYRLQLLLDLASAVILASESRPYFTVSDSRLPQPGGLGPRIYIPQKHGGPAILKILNKKLVRTSKETHHISVREANLLMLFRETISVY